MTTRTRALTASLAGALLLGLLPATTAVAAPTTAAATPTTTSAPTVRAPLDGVWRTDGYGEILDVEHGRLRVFQTSGVGCLPAQTGTAVGPAGADGTRRFDVPDDDAITLRPVTGRVAVEHIDSTTSHRLLTRQHELPTACTTPLDRDPLAVFDSFWSSFQQNYPFFTLHGVDWSATRTHYRSQITAHTTPTQLFRILSAMLTPLHDGHVALIGSDGQVFAQARPGTRVPTPQLDEQVKKLVTATDLPSVGAASTSLTDQAKGRISYATLPGGVGYLRVSGFTGYSDADSEAANRAALDRALKTIFTRRNVAAWRGLMIDLRVNGGGSDALAVELTRHLIDRPQLAYAKRYWRGSSWSAPQPVTLTPSTGPTYAGPLTLLTSGSTVSAGETFTQSLLGRHVRPVLVGRSTQGVFSDTLDRVLPNGWTVTLPNEQYLTARGESFDAGGIPPTIAQPFVSTGDHDALFTTAYRTLTGGRR